MKFPNASLKKVGIVCAVLLLSLAFSTGMNKAFAGQGIHSLLTGWFDTKKDASIEQIDQAITSEKERLMAELREAIRNDLQRAEAELAQFTADETASHLSMLQSYADNLIEGLHIDNSAEKAAIKANLDAALAEGKAQLDGSVPDNPSVSVPEIGDGEGAVPTENSKEKVPESKTEADNKEVVETEPIVKEVDKEQEVVKDESPDSAVIDEAEKP